MKHNAAHWEPHAAHLAEARACRQFGVLGGFNAARRNLQLKPSVQNRVFVKLFVSDTLTTIPATTKATLSIPSDRNETCNNSELLLVAAWAENLESSMHFAAHFAVLVAAPGYLHLRILGSAAPPQQPERWSLPPPSRQTPARTETAARFAPLARGGHLPDIHQTPTISSCTGSHADQTPTSSRRR